MKKITATIILLALVCNVALSQSKSFSILKEKFRGHENVFSITTSGFLTRTILRLAGEHENNKAIRDVKKVRLIVVPKEAFRTEEVTVKGFIKVAKKDSFEELFHVREHGEDVTLMLQSGKKKGGNLYLLLIDSKDELVAMEIKGYIDAELMQRNIKKKKHYYQQEI